MPTPGPTSSNNASPITSKTRSWSNTFIPDPDSSTGNHVTFVPLYLSLIIIDPCTPGFTTTITDKATVNTVDTTTVINAGQNNHSYICKVTITNTEQYTETNEFTKTLIITRPTILTATPVFPFSEHHHAKNYKIASSKKKKKIY